MTAEPKHATLSYHCLVALGANRGDTAGAMNEALRRLQADPGASLLKQSRFFRTPPVGGPPGQGDFLNAAALLATDKPVESVLTWLLEVEREMGRQRIQRWGPREIDLDLLLYESQSVSVEGLVVPHPRMSFRRFVLEPAAEAAPEMKHPEIGWTMQRLLDHLNASPYFLALEGPEANHWAQQTADRFPGALQLDAAASVDEQIALARCSLEEGRLLIAGFRPQALPPEFSPRLSAVLYRETPPEDLPSGPILKLRLSDSTVADDLNAAVEAMR